MRRAALPFLGWMLLGQSAAGQSLDYGALEELFGEPVTTSVTGSPQRASTVPASMAIITADDIRRSGAHDVPGVLSHVTGMNVLRWTNMGADVSSRGYNRAFSSRLLVLVNGRQVYNDYYSYTPWASLPVELEEIRQIEVIKGPNSALFGFNAAGGVINIITWSPSFDDRDYAQVRAGTQDTAIASLGKGFAVTDNWDMRINAGLRSNHDFDTPVQPVDVGARQGDKRVSLRLDNHFRLAEGVDGEVSASWTETDLTQMTPQLQLSYGESKITALKARLTADTSFGLIQATVYENRMDNAGYASSFDGTRFVFPEEPSIVLTNDVTVTQLQDIFKIGSAHTVRLSAEYRSSAAETSPIRGGRVFYGVVSGGGMWEWQLAPIPGNHRGGAAR